MIGRFIGRLFATGLGLWIAARLLTDVDYGNNLWVVAIAAAIFSLVNMLVKPFVVILSLPAIVLTMGLFMFVINGLMLYLVTVIYPDFRIESFSAALVTVIIIWLVNYVISMVTDKNS